MIRAVALLCVISAACKSKPRPHDDALKQQILSGDKAPLRLSPPEIAVKSLATDAESRKLVFVAPITVLERRLDHFQLKNKITIDGPSSVGNRTFEHQLRLFDRNAFSIHHAATNAESVDWIAVDAKAFVKHGKGAWRKKPYTLQHAEVLKNELSFSLTDVYTLFGEQMTMRMSGETTDNGRSAVKYAVDAGPAKTGQGAPSLILKNDVEAVALQGECVVDATSGVLLTADFKITLALQPIASAQATSRPADEAPTPQAKTQMKMRFQWSVDMLGATDKDKLLPTAPDDAVEDKGFDRPAPDILGFWQPAAPATKDDKDKEEDD